MGLLGFVIRRVGISVPTLLLISILVFLLVHLMPGGPLSMYAHQPNITPAQLRVIAHQLGVDRPLPVQYASWLGNALSGHFGYSYTYNVPVSQLISGRMPATLSLMGISFALAVVLSITIGTISAMYRHTWVDRVLSALSYVGLGLPSFWLGLILIEVFGVHFGILPISGMGSGGLGDHLKHLAMPVATLSVLFIAQEARYVRSSMVDVLGRHFIVTARAKGLRNVVVIGKHGLRNGLIPVITVLAIDGATLFGGAVITESIFSWPGIGRLFLGAVLQGDYPIMLAIITLLSGLIVLANIVADMLYAVVDPRVQF
ncbi:MAG: ABC transporter permease [Deinococcales bacterium]